MVDMTSAVYPDISELIPPELEARVPASLANWVTERYELLGPKYLTDDIRHDGRRVNSCMNNSSIQLALEEVVDAVFNVLVWIFKLRLAREDQQAAYSALIGLIELYALLQIEFQRNADI